MHLALVAKSSIVELARDPLLTVACVLLIAVSLAWIVVSRSISHSMKKAARHRAARSRKPARHRSQPDPARRRGGGQAQPTRRVDARRSRS